MSTTTGVIVFAAIAVSASVGGYLLSIPISRRFGQRTVRELSPRRRHAIWVVLGGYVLVTTFAAWEIFADSPAVGIGVLVAVFMLPDFVIIWRRIRRARRPG